jgi:hypothetical protein
MKPPAFLSAYPAYAKSIVDAITFEPFGPNHSFMRSGSVKHRHTKSRGASNTRVMTKSLFVSVIICPPPSVLRSRAAAARCSRYCAVMTIQCTPNLSASMPNRGEKKVLVSGSVTWPPSPSALNMRSASASLLGADRLRKAREFRLPAVAAVGGQDQRLSSR